MGLGPRTHSRGRQDGWTLLQRRRADGRQTHGKSRSFSGRPGDADPNHHEARPHTRQNGSDQQHKTRRGGGACARGTRTGTAPAANSAEGPRKCKIECRTMEELKYRCLPPKRKHFFQRTQHACVCHGTVHGRGHTETTSASTEGGTKTWKRIRRNRKKSPHL